MIGSDFHERDAFGFPTIERNALDAKFPGWSDVPRHRPGMPVLPRVRNDLRDVRRDQRLGDDRQRLGDSQRLGDQQRFGRPDDNNRNMLRPRLDDRRPF